jgi:LacI family transcriptional regulator
MLRNGLKRVDKTYIRCYDNDNGNANKMIPQNRRITIKHVAKEAGVSTQTISRVINDRPDVSPETRQRVLDIINKLGYQPSELARSLIQRRSYTLGVVTAGLKYIGPSRTLNGITTKAEESGYALLLKELPSFTSNEIQPLLQFLLARHIDGILWAVPEIGNNHDWVKQGLNGIHVPVVYLTMQPHPEVSVATIDNYLGGVIATRHLLEQGRHRIGHISGPLDWWEARQRKLGWQDTLKKAGLQVTDASCLEGNWSSSSAEVAFQQLLQSYPDMDSIFVANDQMALSVLRVAHRLGIHVPRDLAVVGFDNLTESAFFWPALTTINQNQLELGGRAVQELVAQIEVFQRNEEVAPKNILLSPDLIVRESSVFQN